MKTNTITLNFIPLLSDDFSFPLFRSTYDHEFRPVAGDEQATKRRLPTRAVDDDYEYYWTTFGERPDALKVLCDPHDNNYATIDALRTSLTEQCQRALDPQQFRVLHGIRRQVEIITRTCPEGDQVVLVEPYYLKSKKKFGFLLDFHFRPSEKYRGTVRALQMSLALDRDGHPNRNHYADRYEHLLEFLRQFHKAIFPLDIDGKKIAVVDSLIRLKDARRLDAKRYIVGNYVESSSQFMGVKNNGPLNAINSDVRLYFVYLKEHIALSRDLYRALRGSTYRTFPGMSEMFKMTISPDNVSGIAVDDFDLASIRAVQQRISQDRGDRPAIAVVLTPFDRRDEQRNDAYWALKHTFLSAEVPIQVVSTNTVNDPNLLKWSTASIGLQVFAKLGGEPWKVRPSSSACLIVGIGQAHHTLEDGRIDRYFAYSVLTDSSGVFKEVRTLSQSQAQESYIEQLSIELERLLHDYEEEFSTFAIHATFAVRREELECISSVLKRLRMKSESHEFVAMKFNSRNRFYGYDTSQNSRVPYESSVLQLARDEFLIWFEGLQYGTPNVGRMVGGPMHVKFVYPYSIEYDRKVNYLQDAINLSGANWRGFNAKSLPVSVYYAQIIARYLREFDRLDMPHVDVSIVPPWFL